MKTSLTKIYDLEESIVASGLPMMIEYDEDWIANEIDKLETCENIYENPHFKRACKLASNAPGSGHDNFLSGILVSVNVTATNAWWIQYLRYHFVQIVSSQSKMHKLRSMLINGTATYSEKLEQFKAILNQQLKILACENDEYVSDEQLVNVCPMGLELTARTTTNYLQLKTIYNQRKNHKLQEWRDFCTFIENLPFAKDLIITHKH